VILSDAVQIDRLLRPVVNITLAADIRVGDEIRFAAGEM
jgi:hypothetical protein